MVMEALVVLMVWFAPPSKTGTLGLFKPGVGSGLTHYYSGGSKKILFASHTHHLLPQTIRHHPPTDGEFE